MTACSISTASGRLQIIFFPLRHINTYSKLPIPRPGEEFEACESIDKSCESLKILKVIGASDSIDRGSFDEEGNGN